jgi:hypothetical protein
MYKWRAPVWYYPGVSGTVPRSDLNAAQVQAGTTPLLNESDHTHDTLVRNARSIETDWINVAFKVTVAATLLAIANAPYIPLIAVYLVVHDLAVTKLRRQLAAGNTSYKAAYLFTIFTTVVFWTGLACWLWSQPEQIFHISALGILYSVPMLGAIRGYRDTGFILATCAVPLGTIFVLTLESLPASLTLSNIVFAVAPLMFGFVVILRSVRGLRRRDERIRMANNDRSRLLAQLERSRSYLEQVTELSGVAGWEIDLPGRACKLSDGAIMILGLSDAPRSLDDFLTHLTSESSLEFQVELGNARRFGKRVDVDVQMKAPAEAPRWIRLVGQVMHHDDGTSRFIGAMQDLSARIAERERERQDEVATSLARLSARTASEFKKDLNEVSRSLAELSSRAKRGTFEHMLVHGMRLSLNRALDTASRRLAPTTGLRRASSISMPASRMS